MKNFSLYLEVGFIAICVNLTYVFFLIYKIQCVQTV